MNISNPFLQMLADGNILVCVKTPKGEIIFQNEPCQKLCVKHQGDRCEEGCMARYSVTVANPETTEGTERFPNQVINGRHFDLLFINDTEHLVTFLYPLDKKLKSDLEYLEKVGLTLREKEIAQMVTMGKTNSKIAAELKISKSTLKTHLNNVYKKLPSHRVALRKKG